MSFPLKVIFKSLTIDKGPCFRLMMVVNLCGLSQLVMQFYAGLSSLIGRGDDWTWIEMVCCLTRLLNGLLIVILCFS